MSAAVGTSVEPSETAAAAGVKNAPPAKHARGEFLFFALRSKKFVISIVILLVLAFLAIFGPIIDSTDPVAQAGMQMRHPTLDPGNWFGTTYFGDDVFAQFVNGLRASFFVGFLGGGLGAVIGMAVGFLAGYKGGWLDEILNMITNIFLVIPTLAVLLVITSYLQARGVLFEAVFIGITSWPWAARAIRAQTFTLRSREFIDLAKLSGRSGWKIIVFEIAPNMSSYLFLTYILLFGGAILIAASLDFIGLGPTGGMSLGLMMYNSVTYGAALQLGIWWWFIPPGIGIIAAVGALYVMNVGLDEIFNPKLRDI
jgi:peptide/nickel transport system permease protein